jgi:hypothetical protein
MATILKAKKADPTPSNLASLVEEAANVVTQLNALGNTRDPKSRKLSGPAFVKAALAVSGADQRQVSVILEALDRPENKMLLPSYRRLFSRIVEPATSSPITRLNSFFDDLGDATLARLQCTRESLQAACATNAAKSHAASFGTLEKVGELEAKAVKLTRQSVTACSLKLKRAGRAATSLSKTSRRRLVTGACVD